MKRDKKFINPEVEIIKFYNEDIILTSDIGDINYPWWNDNEDLPSDTEEF